MTSTQEPNTVPPVSSLYLLEKIKNKTDRSNVFGTKTSKFCFRMISFSSLNSELSFDLEDSEINCDRARATTVNSQIRPLRAIYITCISSNEGEEFFADELHVY